MLRFPIAASLLAFTLPAQWTVARPSDFTPTGASVVDYDPVSGEAYLLQQGTGSPLRMWRFDDGTWTLLTQPAAQPPSLGATCSWPGHGLLLFGNGTWTWNGSTWAAIATTNAPPTVIDMEWDPAHGVAIALTNNLQTWAFDGVDWTLRTSAWPTGGPQVVQAQLAFEPNTQSVHAVAGHPSQGCAMYRWNGASWQLGAFTTFTGFGLCSVPGGVFTSGGFRFPLDWGRTAIWNGSQWQHFLDGPVLRPTSVSWYDGARARLVVTSGLRGSSSGSPAAFGTWYWNGSQWSRPAVGSGPRFVGPQVYDSWRGRTLQFGGSAGFGIHDDDLWARDAAGRWTRLGDGPAARMLHAAAFDSRRGRMVVFGGCVLEPGGGSLFSVDAHTTWEWDGSNWIGIPSPSPQWSQSGFPVGRHGAAMAYDPLRARCVLFGGNFGQGTPLPTTDRDDTWEWDGSSWQRAFPVHVPPASSRGTMWFDASAGTCHLWSSGLWSWDGSDWMAIATPPLPNPNAIVSYDPAREVLVASSQSGVHELRAGAWQAVGASVGALGAFDLGRGRFLAVDEAYWFDVGDAQAATIEPFGASCSGSTGNPVLHGEHPFRTGSVRTLRLANRPLGAAWFGVLGDDANSWLGQSLPYDLAPFGAPGCLLHSGVAAQELVPGDEWSIVVPNAPALLGQSYRVQAFVFDAAANPLGATTSNGVRLRIGS